MTNKTKSLRTLFFILTGIILFIGIIGTGSYLLISRFLAPEISSSPHGEIIDSGGGSSEISNVELPTLPSPPVDPDNLGEVFNAFWTARDLLKDNFIRQPVDDDLLALGATEGLQTYIDSLDFSPDQAQIPADAPTVEQIAIQAETPNDLVEIFTPFWELWRQISYLSLPEESSPLVLMRHALGGMVSALEDDYTNYFDPDLAEQYNTDLSGEYEGIGAWVDTSAEFLTIISPIKNTPAEEAGLRPGDQIIGINGDDMTGVDPSVALKRVLGPAGSKVVLTIQREGEPENFDVEIIRRRIVIPYIESEILEGGIGYLSLARFYDNGDLDFQAELESLLASNPSGLIIDLRGNGGGYLHIAVGITSEFIEEGNILIEEFGDKTTKNYPALSSKGLATEIPLVVLVNGGSASASEIFAGAVRDYQRGTIIGETTFGKGSVQLPISLPDDQGLVSITIAKWLTPNGSTIQNVGIDPDIFVELTEDDFLNDLDPQLDRAIEFLLNGE